MRRAGSRPIFLLSFPAGAQFLFCTPPPKPYCVDGYGPFDEWAFASCRSEVETYRSAIRTYIRCMNDEGDEATTSAN
jgi:hypothetical protein